MRALQLAELCPFNNTQATSNHFLSAEMKPPEDKIWRNKNNFPPYSSNAAPDPKWEGKGKIFTRFEHLPLK